jgi:hypothetical protein
MDFRPEVEIACLIDFLDDTGAVLAAASFLEEL